MAQKTIRFGLHLTLDLYGCPQNLLSNMEFCYHLLENLPKQIGMKALTPPVIIAAEANNKNDPGGFSGFIIIAESHIGMHTFTKRGFASIDVYSCKDFDTKKAETFFVDALHPKDVEKNVLERGTRYPAKDIYK